MNGRRGGGSSPSVRPHGTMSSSRLQDLPDRPPLPTITNHAKNGRRATILTIVPYSSSMRGVAWNGISSRDACARVSFFLPRIKAPEPGTVTQHPHLTPQPAAREFTDNSCSKSRPQNPNFGRGWTDRCAPRSPHWRRRGAAAVDDRALRAFRPITSANEFKHPTSPSLARRLKVAGLLDRLPDLLRVQRRHQRFLHLRM